MMRFRSQGDRAPTYWQKRQLKLIEGVRKRAEVEVVVADKKYNSTFVCDSVGEAYRPLTLWIKEPGTMKWIDDDVREGDVFLDIGANIGIYTIAAAHRVGKTGRVYAVEPHKPNTIGLMRNVLRNDLADRVDILSLALSDKRQVTRFNYSNLQASSTGSQLGSTRVAGTDKEFKPVLSELVLATTVDELVESGAMQPPTLVKIDVDGIEPPILRGMEKLLRSDKAPRGIQVELNLGVQDEIVSYLAGVGYELAHRHLTLQGTRDQAAGKPLNEIPHNALFSKKR